MLGLKVILGQKKIWFWNDILGPKSFRSKKNFGPKNVWV